MYGMEDFYRKKSGERELRKEKKGLYWGLDFFSLRKKIGKGFYHADCLFFLCSGVGEDGEGTHDRLPY